MHKISSIVQEPFLRCRIKIPKEVLSMIKEVGQKHGVHVTNEFASTVHRLYIYSIAEVLRGKGRVAIPSVGVLRIKKAQARNFFHVHLQKIQYSPSRKVVSFKESPKLKQTINSWKAVNTTPLTASKKPMP